MSSQYEVLSLPTFNLTVAGMYIAFYLLPLLMIVLGALLWVYGRPGKLQEAGKLIFFCGMLAWAFGNISKSFWTL